MNLKKYYNALSILTLLLFILIFLQTVFGHYFDESEWAWLWFAVNVIPIFSMMSINYSGYYIPVKSNATRGANLFKYFYALSYVYLAIAILTIVLQPFVPMSPDRLLKLSYIYLIPFQLLIILFFTLRRQFIQHIQKSVSRQHNEQEFNVNRGELTQTKNSNFPPALYQKLINFLTSLPNVHDRDAQHALINSAGLDTRLRNQISIGGSPDQFFQLLLPILHDYGRLEDGRHALEALLGSAKQYVGQDKRDYCDELIDSLKEVLDEAEENTWDIS